MIGDEADVLCSCLRIMDVEKRFSRVCGVLFKVFKLRRHAMLPSIL